MEPIITALADDVRVGAGVGAGAGMGAVALRDPFDDEDGAGAGDKADPKSELGLLAILEGPAMGRDPDLRLVDDDDELAPGLPPDLAGGDLDMMGSMDLGRAISALPESNEVAAMALDDGTNGPCPCPCACDMGLGGLIFGNTLTGVARIDGSH